MYKVHLIHLQHTLGNWSLMFVICIASIRGQIALAVVHLATINFGPDLPSLFKLQLIIMNIFTTLLPPGAIS